MGDALCMSDYALVYSVKLNAAASDLLCVGVCVKARC